MPPIPLQHSDFTLDASGVAGFFGGDEAISAMATVHVYEGRKWLGWYNSPGSYIVAKRYGQLANSRFWDGLFPGGNVSPAVMFELDNMKGPTYHGLHSGAVIPQTGHLAHLFVSECKAMEANYRTEGRITRPARVTIAELSHVPPPELGPKLSLPASSALLAAIPIAVSWGTCIVCGVFRDWWCCSMILLGIVSSGFSCFVIGSGKCTFSRPSVASAAPDGDGLLVTDNDIVILKGREDTIDAITMGKFSIQYSDDSEPRPERRNIGLCSLLLTVQFLSQLLLIPQGTLFGQIMFLTSLAFSWGYNSWLSSLDKVKLQRDMLIEKVLNKPSMKKYELGTRTAMVVFVILALGKQLEEPRKLLENLLPNDTKVWKRWKDTVLERLIMGGEICFQKDEWDVEGYSENEKNLLKTLYEDAEAAWRTHRTRVEQTAG